MYKALIFLISKFLLSYSVAISKFSINLTRNDEPRLRQYHSGVVFQTWNQTLMNNLCPIYECGPLCNTIDSSCSVPTGTYPTYQTIIYPSSTDHFVNFSSNTKCSNECCNGSEKCYRVINKNGDNMTIASEDVLVIFAGKLYNYNLSQIDESCYWSLPLTNCNEMLDNDLWFYFIDRDVWSKVEPSSNPLNQTLLPSKRYGHKSVLISRELNESYSNYSTLVIRKYLYVYGGLSLDCNGACSDLWVYEIPWAAQRYYPQPNNSYGYWNRGNHWTNLNSQINGIGPGRRAFHSMVTDEANNYIYLFGGVYNYNGDYSYSNDLWRFSIQDLTWRKLDYYGISSIMRQVKLWDGSSNSAEINVYDDIFDTDTINFDIVSNKSYNNCYIGSMAIPNCRAYATLSIDSNNNIYILGGSSEGNLYMNDIWKISISSSISTSISASMYTSISNSISTPLSSPMYYYITPNIYLNDINDIAIPNFMYPNGVSSATATFYESQNPNFLFLYGGYNEIGTTSDLWVWNYNTNLWHNHTDVFKVTIDLQTNTSFTMPQLKGHVFLSTTKGFIIHGGVSYTYVNNTNLTTGFNIYCNGIYTYYNLNPSGFNRINNTIYRELAFIMSNGNPCFKESPSDTSYPDTLYPLYNIDYFTYYKDDSCGYPISQTSYGSCYFGYYYCDNGFYGDMCENVICPNSYCINNYDTMGKPQCEFCSKHGVCKNGICICDDGYTGDNCSIVDCMNQCSGLEAGVCITQFIQNQCRCNISNFRGYDDCSIVFCLNDCGDNGVCQNGICSCNAGFNGTDCSVFNISLLDYAGKMIFYMVGYMFYVGVLLNL